MKTLILFLILIAHSITLINPEPLYLYYKNNETTTELKNSTPVKFKNHKKVNKAIKPFVKEVYPSSTRKYGIQTLKKPSTWKSQVNATVIPKVLNNLKIINPQKKVHQETSAFSNQVQSGKVKPPQNVVDNTHDSNESYDDTEEENTSQNVIESPKAKFVTLEAQTGPHGRYSWSYSYPLQKSDGSNTKAYVRSYFTSM